MRNLNSSYNRVLWLISNDIRIKKNQYALILLTCFGVLTYIFFNPDFSITGLVDAILKPSNSVSSSGSVIYFNTGYGEITSNELKYHLNIFPKAVFIVCSIITCLSFIEYSNDSSRRFYISIPAATSEKWWAKVIWCMILFPLGFLLVYHLYALVTYQWGAGMRHEYVKISFLDPFIWKTLLTAIALQGLLLLGSIYFRKYAFIKVFLVGLMTYFLLIAMRNILVFSFFPDLDLKNMGGFFALNGWKSYLLGSKKVADDLIHIFPSFLTTVPSLIWLFITSFGALAISYLKFKDMEA